MKLIVKWLCSAAALLAVAYLYSGVTVTSFPAALLAAAVLGKQAPRLDRAKPLHAHQRRTRTGNRG